MIQWSDRKILIYLDYINLITYHISTIHNDKFKPLKTKKQTALSIPQLEAL